MVRYAIVVTFIALSGCVVTPLEARQTYAAYDGPDALKVGTGGTRLEKSGIDFWTTGAPSRPFRVLGVFTDTRKDRWWDGDALGSGSIARKAREVGANAVIVLSADTKLAGVSSFSSFSGNSSASYTGNVLGNFFSGSAYGSSNGFGFGGSEVINKVTTRFLVVQYLQDDEIAALKIAPTTDASAKSLLLPSPIAGSFAVSEALTRGPPDQYQGPPKRAAKTRSGFCYEVPRGYVGLGTASRPAITSAAPACYELLER